MGIRYKVRDKVSVQVRLLLQKAIGKSLEIMSESIMLSLEGNVNMFSPICVSEIEIIENVGTCIIEVRLVKTG